MNNFNSSNARQNYEPTSPYLKKRRQAQLALVESNKKTTDSPANREMTRGETILMYTLFCAGVMVNAYLFATGDWWM